MVQTLGHVLTNRLFLYISKTKDTFLIGLAVTRKPSSQSIWLNI